MGHLADVRLALRKYRWIQTLVAYAGRQRTLGDHHENIGTGGQARADQVRGSGRPKERSGVEGGIMTRRLYTFTVSHFSEKARWALDFKNIDYVEERLVPGSHVPIVKRMAPGTSVPLLRDGDRIVQGSSAIIDYAEQQWPELGLTPADATERKTALELERWLDCELGEAVRRVFYFHALNHRDLVLYLFNQGGPWWGRMLSRLGYRALANGIRQMYAISRDNAARDEERVHAVFERVDALLAGRNYLVGSRFSRADLTLAALAAPLWNPEQHSTRWPADELYPLEISAFRARFANTRTRDHVMRLYREQRLATSEALHP